MSFDMKFTRLGSRTYVESLGYSTHILEALPVKLYIKKALTYSCPLYVFNIFQVDKTNVVLKENGVQLRLTIVDTPGFGDAVDNSNW